MDIKLNLPKPKIDYTSIKQFCKENTKPLLTAMNVKKDAGRYYCPLCQPVPSDHKTPDMTVRGSAICCWRCGWRGDVISLYGSTRNVGFVAALQQLSGKDFQAAVANYKPLPKKAKRVVYYKDPDEAIASVTFASDYRITGKWRYVEMDGEAVMWVYRIENGTKSYRPVSLERGKGWFVGKPKGKLPLYNLPAITNSWDETVFVVEGEKAADALIGLGLIATTSSGGANGVYGTDWQPLENRTVLIWPDNDKAGYQYADDIRKILPHAYIWKVQGMGEKEDAHDFVQKHGANALNELRRLYRERG